MTDTGEQLFQVISARVSTPLSDYINNSDDINLRNGVLRIVHPNRTTVKKIRALSHELNKLPVRKTTVIHTEER